MSRIKIEDLKEGKRLTEDDMRKVAGGAVFVQYEGIEGEAQDKAHKNWIELLSYSHGVSQP